MSVYACQNTEERRVELLEKLRPHVEEGRKEAGSGSMKREGVTKIFHMTKC